MAARHPIRPGRGKQSESRKTRSNLAVSLGLAGIELLNALTSVSSAGRHRNFVLQKNVRQGGAGAIVIINNEPAGMQSQSDPSSPR